MALRSAFRRFVPLRVRRHLALRDRLRVRLYHTIRPLAIGLADSSEYLRDIVVRTCSDVLYELENRGRDRICDDILDHLLKHPHPYSDVEKDADVPLLDRVSGRIIPGVERILRHWPVRGVVEIGCGNGSVLAWLAERYPAVHFVGIDFQVPPAVRALARSNLEFASGYALDIFEGDRLPTPPDLVYVQFTATLFLPREITRYFENFRRRDVRFVVLNEPVRAAYPVRLNAGDSRSVYMGDRMWKHDYPGIARRAGYEILEFQSKHWSALIAPQFQVRAATQQLQLRYDTHMVQMSARLMTPG
ncbi:MAG: methyltransferase domain-containing protein [Armatimonadetes bacterium]|nr:methyltransferase domain-containing protein [Armatimonadota bacterium]